MHGEEVGNYAYGMWPIFVLAYYRLAMKEERDVQRQFGKVYLDYKARTPARLRKR